MSNNLWDRVADFFKEWDGEDMTKSMPLYVDELRQINSDRIDLIRLERERKEIRDKAIDGFAEKLNNKISEFVLQHKDNLDFASGIAVAWNIVYETAEQIKEVGE